METSYTVTKALPQLKLLLLLSSPLFAYLISNSLRRRLNNNQVQPVGVGGKVDPTSPTVTTIKRDANRRTLTIVNPTTNDYDL